MRKVLHISPLCNVGTPPCDTSHDTFYTLRDWEFRLLDWTAGAFTAADPHQRALYLCGIACAERIVELLRDDFEHATHAPAGFGSGDAS